MPVHGFFQERLRTFPLRAVLFHHREGRYRKKLLSPLRICVEFDYKDGSRFCEYFKLCEVMRAA